MIETANHLKRKMHAKRILLITFEYPIGKKYCGGVGQIVERCRQTLLDLGHEVCVLISAEFPKKYPVQLLLPDQRLADYPDFFTFQKQHPLHKFDLIIQHFVNYTKELQQLRDRKGKRPRIIYHFHSILRRERDSGFNTFNRFLLNQEKMIDIADRIICPSRYEYDNFNRYFPRFSEKISLIENMIDVFPREEGAIKTLKSHYRIRDNDIVSIYVGRIEMAKGAHILIDNLSRVVRRRKNLKIFIVGKVLEKNLYRKLQNVLKKYPQRVFYIKYLGKRQLYQLYHLSHIYINSSLSESFSLSTYEGAFCRNALLLNRLPVFDRFKEGALFFSPRNSNGDEFSQQYERLIRSKTLRTQLGKRAHRATRNFLAQRDLRQDFSRFISEIKL